MIITGLLVGTALGIVMQRGRFCVTGMLRDIFLLKSWRGLVALFIVIAVHSVGIAALTSLGVIAPDKTTFAPGAVIVGGLIFGMAIVLAGGCASGTWYRSGEGLVGSWIALVCYALSAAAMKTGPLTGFTQAMKSWDTGWTDLPDTFGVSLWWFAIPFALFTGWATARFLQRDADTPAVATLEQPAWKKPLHIYVAALAVGVLGVIAWPLSAATGRNDGLGITTPSANLANWAVTGDTERFDWGVLLVLGILVGSFIAARVTGEFRVRVPGATQAARSVVGGVGMGVGASLAGGCTVGNGMVQTSLFSYQGWVALLFMTLGVGIAAKLWLGPQSAEQTGAALPREAAAAGRPAPQQNATVPSEPVISDAASAQPSPAAPGGFQVATGLIELAGNRSPKAVPLGEGRYFLDQMGAVCPFPLIEAKDVMATLHSGEELVIDFDCTQATETIPRWAADSGYAVTGFRARGNAGWQISIRK